MKRIITLSVILSALALAVTGCSNNANNSSSNSSEATSSVTSTSEATSETSNTSETAPADTGDTADTNETAEAPSNADTRAAQYAEAALGAVEWPAMMEVTDAEEAMLQFSIDPALCEEFYFSGNMMSVHLNRILIAKPAAGSEEVLREQFDSYWAYLNDMEKESLYEAQAASLAGMVRGETSDGYYYIIVHEDGTAAEEALLAL